jgi:hypothetical protein
MSPGGHLVTTLAACATGAAYSHSWPLVAGIAAGGFLIDVDHAVDYVLFDGQRDLRPGAFLRYYLNGHMRRTVLMLHSWELFAALGVTAWVTGWPWLVGWLVGGGGLGRRIRGAYRLPCLQAQRIDLNQGEPLLG